MRNGRAEDRHDPVTGEALDGAALIAHRAFHQIRQASHQREGGFIPRPFRKGREADHVGE
jgi:hypothetical protein